MQHLDDAWAYASHGEMGIAGRFVEVSTSS